MTKQKDKSGPHTRAKAKKQTLEIDKNLVKKFSNRKLTEQFKSRSGSKKMMTPSKGNEGKGS